MSTECMTHCLLVLILSAVEWLNAGWVVSNEQGQVVEVGDQVLLMFTLEVMTPLMEVG